MRNKKRLLASLLAVSMMLSPVLGIAGHVSAEESEGANGVTNLTSVSIPKGHGYRAVDFLSWTPETDEFAQDLRAQVPLQNRIDPFAATQANPNLKSDAQLYNLSGDYRTTEYARWMSTFAYNDDFSNYLHSFWQYDDYYGGWHGNPIAGATESSKYINGSLINLPNPAYTNAAHRNGVKSVGAVFIPRPQQYIEELLYKDENGEFPYAKKMIEVMKYFGFDGYFINQEGKFDSTYAQQYKEFIQYLRSEGAHIMWYDATSSTGSGPVYNANLTADHAKWLKDDAVGTVADCIFMNYNWNPDSSWDRDGNGLNDNIESSIKVLDALDVDPYESLFFTTENDKGGFGGTHNSTRNIDQILGADGNPMTSIALFTSNAVQFNLDKDLNNKTTNYYQFQDDYQWMIAERERMLYTSVLQDVKKTDEVQGYSYPEVGVKDASQWTGVSRYISERSVIGGSNFYTSFNTGHGMEYFTNGSVSNTHDWTNMNLQSILPTWQWWIDKADETADSLKVDFDYGDQYYTGANDFIKVGAYNGGSSLVVGGKLNTRNTVRLYKSDLKISEATAFTVTYNKPSATDTSCMSVALYFKDAPETPVLVKIENTGRKTDGWINKTVNLGAYAGRELAAFGFSFDMGQTAVEKYQMNIGEIAITDGKTHTPAMPEGFKITEANTTTGEMRVAWTLGDYNTVKGYELTAVYEDGSEVFLGGSFDDHYYIKNIYDMSGKVTLKLVAVGEDGTRSTAAEASIDFAKSPDKVSAESKAGTIDASWTIPEGVSYDSLVLDVTYDNAPSGRNQSMTVAGDATSAQIKLPLTDGAKYTLTVSPVINGEKQPGTCVKGYLYDDYSEPYDGKIVYREAGSNKYISLDTPKQLDWAFMHLNLNGTTSVIERLKGSLTQINVKNSYGVATVIMEDINGNLSEPVTLTYYQDPNLPVDEALIPDPVLREAVRTQAGTTIKEISEFSGTLDLSNLHIEDYTGLSLLNNLKTLNLTGAAFKSFTADTIPYPSNIESLILKDCEQLEIIDAGAFSALKSLKEINIAGCSSLKVLDLSNTSLEMITYGNTDDFKNLISVNLSNARFDFSEGTPERIFADTIQQQTEGAEDIVLMNPNLTSLSSLAAIEAFSGVSNEAEARKLVDGNTANYSMISTLPFTLVVSFNNVQSIEGYRLTPYTNSYGLKAYQIEYSVDGENYEIVENVSGHNGAVKEATFSTPVEAKYIRFTASEQYGYRALLKELELFGHENTVYPAGVLCENQRPAVYYTYPENISLETGIGDIDPMSLIEAKSVRGTSLSVLKNADFIAEDYDIASMETPARVRATVLGSDGASLQMIPTDQYGRYTVSYLRYDSAHPSGEEIAQAMVTVGNEPILVNKEALLSLIKTAEGIDLTLYTEESVDIFKAALNEAKAVAADDDATQEEVDKAYASLENAVNALKKADSQIPNTGDSIQLMLFEMIFFVSGIVICSLLYLKKRRAK